MGIYLEQQTTRTAASPRQRSVWGTLLWSLVWVLRGVLILLVAIVTGLLIPPSDPDKYRPLAPKTRGKQ